MNCIVLLQYPQLLEQVNIELYEDTVFEMMTSHMQAVRLLVLPYLITSRLKPKQVIAGN